MCAAPYRAVGAIVFRLPIAAPCDGHDSCQSHASIRFRALPSSTQAGLSPDADATTRDRRRAAQQTPPRDAICLQLLVVCAETFPDRRVHAPRRRFAKDKERMTDASASRLWLQGP